MGTRTYWNWKCGLFFIRPKGGGWTKDEVTVKVDSDMDLIIRDGDNFIRLYPEQVVKMLEMIVPIYNKESLQNGK